MIHFSPSSFENPLFDFSVDIAGEAAKADVVVEVAKGEADDKAAKVDPVEALKDQKEPGEVTDDDKCPNEESVYEKSPTAVNY